MAAEAGDWAVWKGLDGEPACSLFPAHLLQGHFVVDCTWDWRGIRTFLHCVSRVVRVASCMGFALPCTRLGMWVNAFQHRHE